MIYLGHSKYQIQIGIHYDLNIDTNHQMNYRKSDRSLFPFGSLDPLFYFGALDIFLVLFPPLNSRSKYACLFLSVSPFFRFLNSHFPFGSLNCDSLSLSLILYIILFLLVL